MNYFELYPGDYLRDTTRLSMLEHGAYLRMLVSYYGEEKPLPADDTELFNVCGASTAADKAAVRKVADRFFPVSADDGLRHNGRADDEIVKAHKRIEAARKNGAKNKPAAKPMGDPVGMPVDTQQITHSGEALHTPPIDQEIPPTAAADPIFGTGLDFLTRKSVPEKSARSFLGLLRKEIHDDLTVSELLTEAERQDVSDPVAWLTKAAKSRKANGYATATHRESVTERMARINAEAEEREARGALDHAA